MCVCSLIRSHFHWVATPKQSPLKSNEPVPDSDSDFDVDSFACSRFDAAKHNQGSINTSSPPAPLLGVLIEDSLLAENANQQLKI